MELWVGALNLGFLYAFMTMGVFITSRIHNFPDITVDGSFTSGAAVTAVLIIAGANPFVALAAGFAAGAFAGAFTAFIHTRFDINGLLAGILVMTGLYSVNLHIMGRSNIPLLNSPSFVGFFERVNPGMPQEIWIGIMLAGIMVLFWIAVALFFKTDLGIALRVTGNNPTMAAANGVNVDTMKLFGIALANGMVGVSGGLVAQYQGFADIGMGIGTIVIGLAAVIIGESVIRMRSMFARILGVIVGSVIFRFMIAFALSAGMNPIDLKLLTALFVLATLVVSKTIAKRGVGKGRFPGTAAAFPARRLAIILGAVVFVAAATIVGHRFAVNRSVQGGKHWKIGVLQVSDHNLLNTTRDSFVAEMARLGYRNGENCTINLQNANGELATVNTIIDKFLRDDVDMIVPISTACAQAAVSRVKDRPVIFATVANPFIIKAGVSDTDHLPNVTGVYGAVKMENMLAMVTAFFPGKKIRIGCIWDPAQANSVYNAENMRKAAAKNPDVEFIGANISGSSEVAQAAASLVQKRIDAFVLTPDNTVYSALESVVKLARPKKIPVILSDVERLRDGGFAAYGYDYTLSGIQAAHLAERIMKGENPASIPFEKYAKITVGINLDTAREYGIAIPPSLLEDSTMVIGAKGENSPDKPVVGIVQFSPEPNVEICKEGILRALHGEGWFEGRNIEIVYRDAQADFAMINSIMQDLVRRKVDVIMPLSTPCVQSAVQFGKGRDDVRVVFTYIYDPYRIGAARTPSDHLPNMTGVACFPPVEGILDLIRAVVPERKTVGVVWNSSEANSESVMKKLRPYAAKAGLRIVEATVTSPAEVLEASRSLVSKGADVFLNAGDNTLNVSFDSFSKVAGEKKIPLFSVDTELADKGVLAAMGPDYRKTGYDGGKYLARVLSGEAPAKMPVMQTRETLLILNMDTARKLDYQKFPDAVMKKADRVIDSTVKTSPASGVSAPASPGPGKKLALFLFNENAILKETERGVMEELESSGILRELNITVDHLNAQNEFTVAQSVAQDIVRKKYDYIVTISTPALQVTANTNKTIPHVFGAVSDPYRMGVAKSRTDHLPNVTGVATLQPVGSAIRIMREVFPKARRIGIVWNPAEACSEACTFNARKAAKAAGFELVESTVNSTGEVADALNSLIAKKIDLFLTSGDNTVTMALESIADTLHRHRIPYFTNTPKDVERGAFLSIGADYDEVGRETGRAAIRVIRGEDPKTIPINDYVPEKIAVNSNLAREYGVRVPDSVMSGAASGRGKK